MKAIVMMPKGDCWHGGGLFVSSKSYWINDGHGHGLLADTHRLVRDPAFKPPAYFGGECPGVYYNRLLRDGWTLRKEEPPLGAQAVFDKAVGHGLVLRKICFAEIGAPPGKGCYYDQHALVEIHGRLIQDLPNWQWADLERGRLVWAEDGRLFAAYVGRGGIQDSRLLHDFSTMRFEAIQAPY